MYRLTSTLARAAWLCAAWLLLAPLCSAQEPAAALREYMRAEVEKRHFRGSVLVAKGGRVLFAESYGPADAGKGLPNTSRTKFRLGSLTKQFTAAAVVILQERAALSVQDPVCNYLPRCPASWRPITLHNLLTHTSGLPDVDYTEQIALPMTADSAVGHIGGKPLLFGPGRAFRYSNANYVLLGYVIEKASGVAYETFIRRNIFRPLGMRDSGYEDPRRAPAGRALGYSWRRGAVVGAAHVDMSIPFSAGGLYSTAEDLYRWDQALYTEKLVSRGSLETIFTPFMKTYGYGWYVSEFFKRRYVNHGGWIDGFAAAIARFPDEKVTAIVLSNQDSAPANTIARNLSGIVLGLRRGPEAERQAVEIDPERLDAYVGRYELAPNFIITVTREGGRLMGQATGRPKLVLHPEAGTKFFVEEFDAQIVFVADETGRVSHSVVSLNGREAQAKKIR